jgi:hypothetical protein
MTSKSHCTIITERGLDCWIDPCQFSHCILNSLSQPFNLSSITCGETALQVFLELSDRDFERNFWEGGELDVQERSWSNALQSANVKGGKFPDYINCHALESRVNALSLIEIEKTTSNVREDLCMFDRPEVLFCRWRGLRHIKYWCLSCGNPTSATLKIQEETAKMNIAFDSER